MTENEFLRRVLDLARLYKWRCAHFRPAMTARGAWVTRMDGDTGVPDLILVRGKRCVFAELKTEKGRVSEEQGKWLRALAQTTVESYLWRPSNFEAIIRTLALDS